MALTRKGKWVEATNLSLDSVKVFNAMPLRRDLWKISWTLDLSPITLYMYFMDGSKQEDDTLGCAFFAIAELFVVGERQYRLSDSATIFPAEVNAMKEAKAVAQSRGLSEIDIYSGSRLAIEKLNSLALLHRAFSENKTIVKHTSVKIFEYYIKAHVGSFANERIDVL